MVRIKLITIGKVREPYLIEGCREFEKRLHLFCKLDKIVLKDQATMGKEADLILEHIKDEFIIVLDEKGKQTTSKILAEFIRKKTIDENRDLCFVIGSANGLSDKVKQRADLLLSLSQMTFTHEMVQLFLFEQIYRAYMINTNREYHK